MSKRILIIVTNPAPAPLLWENFQREYKGSPINDDNIKSIDVGSCDKIYLIKQQDRKKNTDELLNNVINLSGSDVSIIIAYHEESISTDTFNKFILIPFHHDNEEEIYRDYLCPLSIRQKDFGVIWNGLLIGKSNYLNKLRSDILTPFIPFHLFHQLDNNDSSSNDREWQNIFKECCSVINNTDTENNIEKKFNKLIELKKDIPLDFKDCSTGRFKELKEIFQKSENDCVKNTEKKNCLKIIEDFAQCLEKIVNCIESGEEASAKNK